MIRRKLDNWHIDEALSKIADFLACSKVEPKDALRTRLAAEETLLNYQERLGTDASFTLKCVKRFGNLRIELTFPGEQFPAFVSSDEEDGEILCRLLGGLGFSPSWQYKNGANVVVFNPPAKKPPQFLSLLAAVLLAVISGSLCLLLPETVRSFLADDLVTPLFDTFMGLLSAVAGPMIFLSVAWGIYSIGDTTTLGRIGKRMVSRFLTISFLLAMVVAGIFLPFFPVSHAGSGGSFSLREPFEMILDIVPDNFIAPFVTGNPIQIIFLSILVGLAVLILGSRAGVVAGLIEQANYIVQLIMSSLSRLIPFFVFASLFNMILHGDLNMLRSAYKLFPLVLLGDAVLLALYICFVCIRKQVSPVVLVKKIFPTFLIGLTTASSTAAFTANKEACRKELGISQKIVDFGVPLGQVLFMPGCIVLFLSAAMCMAENYAVPITPGWMISALLIVVVLAVAAPPVPGGGPICYTMLCLQLGLPAEAVAVLIALNVVLEFLTTGCNLFCLQTELVELAGDLDLLDSEVLRSRKI